MMGKRFTQHTLRMHQNIESRHVDQYKGAHGESKIDRRRVDCRRGCSFL